jgi:membrane-bound lytic murein transglycosylase A
VRQIAGHVAGHVAGALLVGAALLLAACEKKPPVPEEAALRLTPVTFADLPGWPEPELDAALPALARSCSKLTARALDAPLGNAPAFGTTAQWAAICAALAARSPATSARAFLETWLTPYLAADRDQPEGLFTGYFAPELPGSRQPDARFTVPLLHPPGDLITVDLGRFREDLAGERLVGRVDGQSLVPYWQRADIDNGALAGQGLEFLWLEHPLDAFLLHVQGSGRILLPDGSAVRVGFAGHNGHGYASIGRALIAEGELEPHEASWAGIRGWIEAHPDRAMALLQRNPRFIFFREQAGDGPIGAEGVVLTDGRSLAVDRRFVPLGVPVWLVTTWPGDADKPLRRLLVAQDTGGAIKGPVRGDLFWGHGDAALALAGKMRSRGRYYLLLPRAAAPSG